MSLWVPSVFSLEKVGEIYSTALCSYLFVHVYLPPLESSDSSFMP